MTGRGFVSVSALTAGHLTLPERFFVTPVDDTSTRKTVPSLSFLIQHKDGETGRVMRLIFDLGIRRKLKDYANPIYQHAMTRQPLSGEPDVLRALESGGLIDGDIDIVIFSHLHWDHIGTPSDFPTSTYLVGPGAIDLIDVGKEHNVGSHNHFEKGLLDLTRTIELPSTDIGSTTPPREIMNNLKPHTEDLAKYFDKAWQRKHYFDNVLDMFDDGSLYLVSAPGHLDGHINLLCRLESGSYAYLAGDACHDGRILTGEKDIATWIDPNFPDSVCCIHKNKAMAEKTIAAIRNTIEDPGEFGSIEVIFAHDASWEKEAIALGKFFPGHL